MPKLAINLSIYVLLSALLAACTGNSTTDGHNNIAVAYQSADLRVPINFWVVTAPSLPEVSYDVSDQALTTYVNQANQIWAAAGLAFYIDNISRVEITPSAAQDLQHLGAIPPKQRDRLTAQRVANSSQQIQLTESEFNIVLMKEIGPAGATSFNQQQVIYIAESNRRGEIRRPTILAHELGHALGLRHVLTPNSQCNLMTTGDCGSFNASFTRNEVLVKTLHPCQVAIARKQAVRGFSQRTLARSISCVKENT